MRRHLFTFVCAGLLTVAGLSLLQGCDDDDDDLVVVDTGTVELRWTIAGGTDADACDRYGVESLQAVFVDDGFAVREFEIPCEDFSADVDVLVDDYQVRTTLIDTQGVRVTLHIVTTGITVERDETVRVMAAFPADSFLDIPDGGFPNDAAVQDADVQDGGD